MDDTIHLKPEPGMPNYDPVKTLIDNAKANNEALKKENERLREDGRELSYNNSQNALKHDRLMERIKSQAKVIVSLVKAISSLSPEVGYPTEDDE